MTNQARVTIYNRWLSTLGGGEKTSLGIAEYLSRDFHVSVISHKEVPRSLAEERLHLDLSRVDFVTIPEKSVLELSPITSDCDIFISASHLDYFTSLARLSALLIFFPAKLNSSVSVRQFLKKTARNWLDMPLMTSGVCGYSTTNAPFRWYIDRVFRMELPPSRSRAYQVRLALRPLLPDIENITIYLDGELQEKLSIKCSSAVRNVALSVPGDNKQHEVMIYVNSEIARSGVPHIEVFDLDLSLPYYQLFRNLFEQSYKDIGYRLYYQPQSHSVIKAIDSYHKIWTTSEYSQDWIERYWRRTSEVLYPPFDFAAFRVGQKANKILTVGRFFAGSHNKKHVEMIGAFKSLVDGGLKGWEFHLVGNRSPGDIHDEYFETVCKEAAGYPIFIHANIPHQELLDLYATSAIYWHASGYGENERRSPEKFEHFGISTLESMAAGCVPVVIGKGGQPEIVDHEENGYLWNNINDLKRYTLHLVRDPALRNRLSINAVNSSKKFNQENFQAKIDRFIERNNS